MDKAAELSHMLEGSSLTPPPRTTLRPPQMRKFTKSHPFPLLAPTSQELVHRDLNNKLCPIFFVVLLIKEVDWGAIRAKKGKLNCPVVD